MSVPLSAFRLLAAATICLHYAGCGRFGVELTMAAETEMDPGPSTAMDAAIDVGPSTMLDATLDPATPDAFDGCAVGLVDCDGLASTGCETDLSRSVLHCGGCNAACTNAHGGSACSAGSCVASCTVGFADCDGDQRNGCETSLDTASDCGACGSVCSATGGRPLCTATGCGTTCDVTGTWAVQLDFPVRWPAASVISAGSGRVRYWQRLELMSARGGVGGTATSCGTELPSSQTDYGGGEKFAPIHPDTLFDVEPPFFAPVAIGMWFSGDVPGSTFTLPTFAMPRGIQLANPLADAWPAVPGLVTQLDDDKDGQLGFTVPFKTGGGWVYPALNLFRSVRADRSYAADRLI